MNQTPKRPYQGRYIRKHEKGFWETSFHYITEPTENTQFFKTVKDVKKAVDDFLAWTRRTDLRM